MARPDLAAYARKTLADWAVPGAAVGIVRGSAVDFAEGFGVASIDTGRAVGTDTLFGIGSLTKVMTATALGILVDEGRLGWDDLVCDRLPGYAVAHSFVTREATIRDLLCHRTGVEDAPLLYTGAECSPRALLGRLRLLGQEAAFRSRFVYNNLMYLALGFLIEEVSGVPYADFLQRRLFEPLGMRRTRVGAVDDADAAVAHLRDGEQVRTLAPGCGNLDAVAPCGAVRSTLDDMLRWAALFTNRGKVGKERLVSADVLHEIESFQTVVRAPRFVMPDAQFQGYGLGWRIGDFRGRKIMPAGGRIAGMTAEFLYVPAARVAVVVLANLDLSWMGYALGYELLDDALGEPSADWSTRMLKWLHADKAEQTLSPVAHGPCSLPADAYSGAYDNELLGRVEVSCDGELRLRYNQEVTGVLAHDTFDTFVLRSERNPLLDSRRARVTFRLDPLARVEAVELAFPVFHHFGEFDTVRFKRTVR